MFKEVPSQFDFPKAEKEILAFWETNKIYEKSLAQRKGCKPFVFFEGPPTANGLPHPGHCLTRAIKDLFPRYKTMTGHYCLRKGGWDTHGLPVEVEVCKELGIHTKEEIEKYGVEAFNKKCLESVFRYTKEWEELTRRLGFWVNLDEAYVTYHQSYIESVWWSLKQLFDARLLYQGHKIVWWWAQGGTALSAGEVGQGYREVDDPSVYVRFPIVMDDRAKKFIADCGLRVADLEAGTVSLLVWTTTPWTLPSNTFAAVHKDFDYAVVHDEETGERLIFAAALVEQIAKKAKKTNAWKVERTVKGAGLVGLSYRPPFDYYRKRPANEVVPDAERGITFGDYKPALLAGGSDFACWRVLHADFVTLESGSGLVHEAPAFGEVDFNLLMEERKRFKNPDSIPLLCAVAPNGAFTDDALPYKGRWVKECDKDIIRDMKERGLLLHQEQYRHDYPFCWRAEEDPLIQYPRRSWFIRTTQFKEAMLENNQHIHWLPEHIKEGRFGNFLKDNVDWSLSRERYWGTPLPIWVCEACGQMEAVDSYESLVSKPGVGGLEVWETAKKKEPGLSVHLKVHKPYIDAITYDCPKCKTARMKRVPEVIDCWYDSGAMPFAQWGFPHLPGSIRRFAEQFPAHFISEALDQTRGWFYSLVAISTILFSEAASKQRMATLLYQTDRESLAKGLFEALPIQDQSRDAKGGAGASSFGYQAVSTHIEDGGSELFDGMTVTPPHPFRNCIVLGLLMGEDGQKMSKQKKNYKEPTYIFEHEGADAMRWLFFSGQTPWTSIQFKESAIAEGQREFLIRLYNCYSFFVIYANIDKWTPGEGGMRNAECGMGQTVVASELDRWIRSELAACSVKVFDAMEAYDNYSAARAMIIFVDALSNWYVRRSRDRFWRSGMDEDKKSAYQTLYDCLVTTAKLIAPFTPFFADNLYQNLVRTHHPDSPESVHLCDYPILSETRSEVERRIDSGLNDEIELVRQVVSCGRAARSAAKLRVRQPLAAIEMCHKQQPVIARHEAIIKDELNVRAIEYVSSKNIAEYVQFELKPDFKKIGPKHGPLAPKIKAALAAHRDVDKLMAELESRQGCAIEVEGQAVELAADELAVELHAKEGWAAERIPGQGILVLDTHLTPELLDEGLARDLVNQIQQVRKSLNLRYEQRIDLAIVSDVDILRVVNKHAEHIQHETLAQNLLNRPLAGTQSTRVEIEGHAVEIYVHPL